MLQFRPLTIFPGDDMVPLQELLSSMLLDKCCHTCHIEGPCLGVQSAGTKVLLGLRGPSNRCGTDGALVEGSRRSRMALGRPAGQMQRACSGGSFLQGRRCTPSPKTRVVYMLPIFQHQKPVLVMHQMC